MDRLRVDKTYECPEAHIIFMPQEKSVKLKSDLDIGTNSFSKATSVISNQFTKFLINFLKLLK